jgi:hypothetical protein
MADPTEMRVKEQRRADALRANLKRRKAQTRIRDTEPATREPSVPCLPLKNDQPSDA